MAKKKVNWVFDLLDRVSAPVKAIGASIDALSSKFENLIRLKKKAEAPLSEKGGRSRDARGRFVKGAGGSGGGEGGGLFGGFTGIVQLDAAMAVFNRVAGFAKAVGGAAAEMAGFALSTASAKTNLLIGFETMLKSKDAARGVVAQINRFAAETPFEQADVAKSIRTLMGAQFSQEESFNIFRGLGDVSALDGFNPQALDGMVRVFTQMKAKGKLLAEELNQLSENSGGLLGKFQVQNAVMKLTGKTAQQVGKMLETGKVDAALGAKAILTAIEDNLSGGKLGNVMAKMAGEIPGLLSTIKDNLTAELIPSIDDNQGFSAVRGMVRAFAAATDRAKPFLQESFGRLFGAIFGGAGSLSGDQGQATFEAMLAGVGRGVQRVASVFEVVGPYVRAFAYGFLVGLQMIRNALSPMVDALARAFGGESLTRADILTKLVVNLGKGLAFVALVAGAVVSVMALVSSFMSIVAVTALTVATTIVGAFSDAIAYVLQVFSKGSLVQAGADLLAGLGEGILGGLDSLLDRVAGVGQAVIAKVRSVFDSHSPSRVMMSIGGDVAEGFALGVEAGGPRADRAVMGAIAPPQPAFSLGGMAGSFGGGTTVYVQVGDTNVYAPAGVDAQEVARLVHERMTGAVAAEIRRLAASLGGAPSEA